MNREEDKLNPLNISCTKVTPRVQFDAETGILEMSGNSQPYHVLDFYNPILEWLDKYALSPSSSTVFNFKLVYFNTASAKIILDIMLKLEKMPNVTIKWFYASDDDDMKVAGEEYADLLNVAIETIEY